MGRSCIFDAVAAADGQQPSGLVVRGAGTSTSTPPGWASSAGVYAPTGRVSPPSPTRRVDLPSVRTNSCRNPDRILLVLDNSSIYTREFSRSRARELGIAVFLHSDHRNSIRSNRSGRVSNGRFRHVQSRRPKSSGPSLGMPLTRLPGR